MKEAERLAERLEKRVEYPTQGGNSSVMWFDKDGKEWTADTGQITQLRNPDGPEAAALIRSQAEELERLREALREIAVPIPKDFQPDGSAERGHLSRSYKAGVYDRAHVKARAALGER